MMRAALIGLAGMLTVAALPAAQLEAVDVGGDYVLKLEGPIESGLRAAMLKTIRARNRFPVALQLRSPGGDLDEAYAIGRLVRETRLATTVREQCDGACFLLWAAGVNRDGRGVMDIGLAGRVPDTGRLGDYLDEMGVPSGLTAVARANASVQRTVAALKDQIGQLPDTHTAWLNDQCPPLDEPERRDVAALEALTMVEASLNSMGMGGSDMYNLDAATQQRAARAREFTVERREELRQRKAALATCRDEAVARTRAAWLGGVSDR